MAKKYDASLTHRWTERPADWLRLFGLSQGRGFRVLDTDLSTVTASADKVLWIRGRPPWILHVELQSRWEPYLDRHMLRYNALLVDQYGVPVHSVVVLTHPKINSPRFTGVFECRVPGQSRYLEFCYQVLRVWEQPAESYLAAGLGPLPLAPLADIRATELPGVIRRMEEVVRQEARPEEVEPTWVATHVLMGLRYPMDLIRRVLRGVMNVEDSVTYQAMMAKGEEKGRAAEALRILRLLGEQHYGRPDAQILAALEGINDVGRLEQLTLQLGRTSSWQELLATPDPRRRRPRARRNP